MDQVLTSVVYGAFVVIALTWLGWGFALSVNGIWWDRDRKILLHQFGPWLWGRCETTGGFQQYRGVLSFGRVLLSRRDFGEAHLRALGFSEEQARLVDGNIMVRLKLRLEGDHLEGELEGTRFQFAPDSVKIVSVNVTLPEARSWERNSCED